MIKVSKYLGDDVRCADIFWKSDKYSVLTSQKMTHPPNHMILSRHLFCLLVRRRNHLLKYGCTLFPHECCLSYGEWEDAGVGHMVLSSLSVFLIQTGIKVKYVILSSLIRIIQKGEHTCPLSPCLIQNALLYLGSKRFVFYDK